MGGQAGWEGSSGEVGDRGLRPGSATPSCTKLGKALWARFLIARSSPECDYGVTRRAAHGAVFLRHVAHAFVERAFPKRRTSKCR